MAYTKGEPIQNVPDFFMNLNQASLNECLVPNRTVAYIDVSKSRNSSFYAVPRRRVVCIDGPATYDRPIFPKNNPRFTWIDRTTWEDRAVHYYAAKYKSDPFRFYIKYHHLIHFMDKKINRQSAVVQPWTRGMAFTQVCIAVWAQLRPLYMAALRKLERKRRGGLQTRRILPTNCYTLLDVADTLSDDTSCVDEGAYEPAPRTSRKREVPLPKWDKSYPIFAPTPSKVRNSGLLAILRAIIQHLKSKRLSALRPCSSGSYCKGSSIQKECFKNKFAIRPEGNEGPEDLNPSTSPEIHESSRVCIVETHDCSSVIIPGMEISGNYGAGDVPRTYPSLLNDEILFDTFTWQNKPVDTLLKEYNCPSSFIPALKDNPIAIPFAVHQYWRGDLQIRILVNANKFQVGQLQVAWYYDTLSDSKFSLRENIYTSSQTPHALINAGSSNEACLTIGYRSPFLSLPITGKDKYADCLNMGRLQIRVINPLTSADTIAKECSVSIFIKFLNSQFYGARSLSVGTFVNPEMMEGAAALATVAVAERVLNTVLPDRNRDNPPVAGPSSHMIPHAMQSLCIGTGASEPLNCLRLDSRGQVPHLETPNTISSWRELSQTYGLIKTLSWTKDHYSGTQLMKLPAAPIFPLNHYAGNWKVQSETCYQIPPVAVASNLFSYWRGCMKLRLDIVASAMHTGRLAVAYIPRTMGNITLAQAKGSPYVILDLKDGVQSYTINVPFISNKYFWPRAFNSNSVSQPHDPPGQIFVYVLNKLIPMDSVSNTVYINVYWAAGENFELAVPCQPAFGTSFFTSEDKPSQEVKAYGGYWPFYWGYYGGFYGGVKAIARYGKGWQHVAQFQNLRNDSYYTVNSKYLQYMPPNMIKNDGTIFVPKFFGPIDIGDGAGLVYMGVFASEDIAKQFAAAPSHNKNYALFMDVQNNDDGPWSSDNINPVFDEHRVAPAFTYDANMVFAYPENNPTDSEATHDAPIILDCTPCPIPNISAPVFGENFDDIKTLCRRYQPYAMFQGVISSEPGAASIVLPLVPQGLDLDIDGSETKHSFYNRYVRDGTIPIIASGYRYHRCSLRFRVVVPNDVKCNIWVQHRPDIHSDTWLPTIISNDEITSRFLNSGYSSGFQTTKINNTFSFEVPYYEPYPFLLSQRTLLSRPVAQSVSSLGNLYIGFEASGNTPITAKFPVTVFYSLGDDGFFEFFQGFPPMICIAPYTPKVREVVHEGLFDKMKDALDTTKSLEKIADKVVDASIQNMDKVIDDSGIKLNVTHNVRISDDTKEYLSSVGQKSSDFLNKMTTTNDPEEACGIAQQFINWLGNITGGVVDFGIDLVSQIMHCAINPCKEAVCIATVTILIKLGILKPSMFEYIGKYMKNMLDYFNICEDSKTPLNPDHLGNASEIKPESSMDMIMEFIDVAFVAVSTVLQVTVRPPTNLLEFSKLVTKEITTNVRNANQITMFMKNNILLFHKIAEYCTAFINRANFMEKIVEDDMIPLMAWVDEAEILLDPRNDEKSYAMDSTWSERLENAYYVGTVINKHFERYVSGNGGARGNYSMFSKIYGRLCKKRTDMYKRGRGTVSRREPFTVWIYGSAGVGKSQLAQKIIPKLLHHAGIKYVGEPIYTLPSGAKYWTGCRSQPAMLLDDFLNVQTGEVRDESIRHIFAIKSPAALNPPMAHLDDKELRYAPEIVIICSNYDFPELANVEMQAVYRRREVLLRCSLEPSIVAAGFKNLTDDSAKFKEHCLANNVDYHNFDHLDIQIAESPSTPTTRYRSSMTYNNICAELIAKFDDYRKDQEYLYQTRIDSYNSTVFKDSDEPLSLREKMDEYRRFCLALQTFKWHENTSFKNILRLSSIYSKTGTCSDEMRAALKETFRSLPINNIKPENDPGKVPPDPDKDEIVLYPPNVVDKIVVTTSDTLADVTTPVPEPELTIVESIVINNIIYSTHTNHCHDAKQIETMKARVKTFLTTKYPISDAFALGVLDSLTELRSSITAPWVMDSERIATGIPFVYYCDRPDGGLYCANCGQLIRGASFHPACESIINLDKYLGHHNYFLRKSIVFTTSKLNSFFKNVKQSNGIDAIMMLFHNKDAWNMIPLEYKTALETCVLSKTRCKSLDEATYKATVLTELKTKVTLEAEAANKELEIAREKFPCIHAKINDTWMFEESEEGGVDVFTPFDINDLTSAPDGSCGDDCLLVKAEESGRHLYSVWSAANTSSIRKPKYFMVKDLQKLSDKDEPSSPAVTPRKTIYQKFKTGLVTFWEKLCKLGKWMWRYIKPALRALWTFMKYAIPFFLLIGAIWGAYLYATGVPAGATPFGKLATLVGVGGVCNLTQRWSNPPSGDKTNWENITIIPKCEGTTSYTENARSAARNPMPKHVEFARPQSVDLPSHQNGANSQKITEIIKLIHHNTYFVNITNSTSKIWSRVFGIYQNYFLIMKHYWEHWVNSGATSLTIWKSDNTINIEVPMDQITFSFLQDKSLAIMQVKPMAYVRKMVHHFASATEHTVPRGECFAVEVLPSHITVHPLRVEYMEQVTIGAGSHSDVQPLDGVYTYSWHGNGRCGSYILAPHLNHPIIGIHCAGGGSIGYADPTTREMFSKFDIEVMEPGHNQDVVPNYNIKGSYIPIGRTDTKFEHHESGITRIVPSAIHGVYPVVTAPAPLKKNDDRVPVSEGETYSPLWSGVANMCKLTKCFPKQLIDNANSYLVQRLLTICKPIRNDVQTLTFNEAICGIPGLEHYEPITMSTSEGFPWSRYRPSGAHNKEWLFEMQPDEMGNRVLFSIFDGLFDQINAETFKRENGIPVSTIFDDCLKDARLPLDKICKPGKTRIFSISPIQYTIVFKRYFGDFLAAFTACRLKFNHAIGISADGPEWACLVRELSSKGSHFITGDYKNFGPGLNTACLQSVCDAILSWCAHHDHSLHKDINNRVRQALLNELICAKHCAFDTIYRVLAGIPSGCPATAPLNSLVNELYILCAYQYIMRDTDFSTLDNFYRLTKLITYGDDFIMSVHSSIVDKFNGSTIQNFFKMYDIEITSANKDVTTLEPFTLNLSDCIFLKRGFVKHPTRPYEFLAPLDLDVSVKDVANWIHRTPDIDGATKVNAEACIRNAFGHGEVIYNQIKKKILAACVKANIPILVRSWSDYDNLFFSIN